MQPVLESRKSTKILMLGAIASFAGLVFLLYSTTPERVGVAGIAGMFALIYFFSFTTLELLLRALKIRKSINKDNLYITAIIAFLLPMLLAIQSLGQLNVRDIAIVLALIGILLFYWSKK